MGIKYCLNKQARRICLEVLITLRISIHLRIRLLNFITIISLLFLWLCTTQLRNSKIKSLDSLEPSPIKLWAKYSTSLRNLLCQEEVLEQAINLFFHSIMDKSTKLTTNQVVLLWEQVGWTVQFSITSKVPLEDKILLLIMVVNLNNPR